MTQCNKWLQVSSSILKDVLSTGPPGKNFSENLMNIRICFVKKMPVNRASAKLFRPQFVELTTNATKPFAHFLINILYSLVFFPERLSFYQNITCFTLGTSFGNLVLLNDYPQLTHLPLKKMAVISQVIFSFQMNFRDWFFFYFESNFTEVCS